MFELKKWFDDCELRVISIWFLGLRLVITICEFWAYCIRTYTLHYCWRPNQRISNLYSSDTLWKGTERNENVCIVCFNRKLKERDPNFHQESAGLFWRRLAQVLFVFQARAVDFDLVVEQGGPAMRFGDWYIEKILQISVWLLVHEDEKELGDFDSFKFLAEAVLDFWAKSWLCGS